MINQQLSEIFEKMAQILDFIGDASSGFKSRAFRNVAISIVETPNIEILAQEKRLREIPGVGQGIEMKIEEFIKTGKIKEFEALKKTIPEGFFDLLAIPSLGPKKVSALYNTLGIKNIADLKKAIAAGKVQKLPKFGEQSTKKILEGIEIKTKDQGRRPIGTVFLTVEGILENLRKCPEIKQVVPAGSFRRSEETVGDIDILATGKNAAKIMDYFRKQPYIMKIVGEGPTKMTILTKDTLQVDLRVVEPHLFGSALQYFTGSKLHNVHLRTLAKAKGFKLSEYGFFKGDKLVASKTEEECYKSIGMQYIPPEIRTDTGEIEAAMKYKIPTLIELKDIKGDLHSHSTYSDGRNSIREMALAAHKKGYQYIALTDHSPSLTIANGLNKARLKQKKKEIYELNEELPIKILFGTEVDILKDGSIDYPDEILREFDIVVASVHSFFKQDNTDRILKAMENPYVHIIGHPSGRLIGRRAPYMLQYEKLYKKASETGTILEIDAQYLRLDLQDNYIREAKKWGCKFSIDSDAHSVSELDLMDLGVRWARRGWIEKKDIINTLSLNDLKKSLK